MGIYSNDGDFICFNASVVLCYCQIIISLMQVLWHGRDLLACIGDLCPMP